MLGLKNNYKLPVMKHHMNTNSEEISKVKIYIDISKTRFVGVCLDMAPNSEAIINYGDGHTEREISSDDGHLCVDYPFPDDLPPKSVCVMITAKSIQKLETYYGSAFEKIYFENCNDLSILDLNGVYNIDLSSLCNLDYLSVNGCRQDTIEVLDSPYLSQCHLYECECQELVLSQCKNIEWLSCEDCGNLNRIKLGHQPYLTEISIVDCPTLDNYFTQNLYDMATKNAINLGIIDNPYPEI